MKKQTKILAIASFLVAVGALSTAADINKQDSIYLQKTNFNSEAYIAQPADLNQLLASNKIEDMGTLEGLSKPVFNSEAYIAQPADMNQLLASNKIEDMGTLEGLSKPVFNSEA